MGTEPGPQYPWGELCGYGRFDWERIILRCRFPRQSTQLVAMTLAVYADAKTGGNARPGQERLARDVGLSPQMTGRHLRALEMYGLVVCEVRGSSLGRGGRGMASIYKLTVPHAILEWLPQAQDQESWDLGSIAAAEAIFTRGKRTEQGEATTGDPTGTPVAESPCSPKNTVTPVQEHRDSATEHRDSSTGTPVAESPLPLSDHSVDQSGNQSSSPQAVRSPTAPDFVANDDLENLTEEENRVRQLAALEALMTTKAVS